MAKPVWQQNLQANLNDKPLVFVGKTSVIKHQSCLDPSEKAGKKITVRLIANYNCFNTCAKCGEVLR